MEGLLGIRRRCEQRIRKLGDVPLTKYATGNLPGVVFDDEEPFVCGGPQPVG